MRNHRHIGLVLRWIDLVRSGRLDAGGLQANLYAIEGALEADTPPAARRAIAVAEGEAEDIRFLVAAADQPAALGALVTRLERAILGAPLRDTP